MGRSVPGFLTLLHCVWSKGFFSRSILFCCCSDFSQIDVYGCIMATFACRVQFLDDTDPFNSTNFPEPTRPPHFTFREDIPLINQVAGVHRLLKAPHKVWQTPLKQTWVYPLSVNDCVYYLHLYLMQWHKCFVIAVILEGIMQLVIWQACLTSIA